jgi:hypothetical protein
VRQIGPRRSEVEWKLELRERLPLDSAHRAVWDLWSPISPPAGREAPPRGTHIPLPRGGASRSGRGPPGNLAGFLERDKVLEADVEVRAEAEAASLVHESARGTAIAEVVPDHHEVNRQDYIAGICSLESGADVAASTSHH